MKALMLNALRAIGLYPPMTEFESLKDSANRGDPVAQCDLGLRYENGNGVPQDYAEAVKWYRKSSSQGYAMAQWSLGVMYANGHGVPQDYDKAVNLYKKAAAKGNDFAQFYLGVIYSEGISVPQDYVEAHKWFDLAASHSQDKGISGDSVNKRDILASRMTPEQVEAARELAREWKPSR